MFPGLCELQIAVQLPFSLRVTSLPHGPDIWRNDTFKYSMVYIVRPKKISWPPKLDHGSKVTNWAGKTLLFFESSPFPRSPLWLTWQQLDSEKRRILKLAACVNWCLLETDDVTIETPLFAVVSPMQHGHRLPSTCKSRCFPLPLSAGNLLKTLLKYAPILFICDRA